MSASDKVGGMKRMMLCIKCGRDVEENRPCRDCGFDGLMVAGRLFYKMVGSGKTFEHVPDGCLLVMEWRAA